MTTPSMREALAELVAAKDAHAAACKKWASENRPAPFSDPRIAFTVDGLGLKVDAAPEIDAAVKRLRNAWAATRTALAAQRASEPVAWRHSLTHSLHDTEDEVQLADADSCAQPLYLAATPPAAPQGPEGCAVDMVSSRICQHGTKSCTVDHAAAPQVPAIAMRPMESEDGRKGWYIDHPEFYCDIEPDKETGKLEVFFRDRATKKEAFGAAPQVTGESK